MEIYEYYNSLLLKVAKNNFLIITQEKNTDELKKYVCSYDVKVSKKEKRDLYEIIFNENIKNKMIEYEKYIPTDIHENCMKCNYYSSCKYNKNMLRNHEETNKILKEYKDFIKTIKDGE